MVVEVISKYLATNKRLVVPNLGTFIVKKAGEQILFSNLMKGDDGVLRGLLVEDGLSAIEAAAVLDRFVFEANFRLQQGTDCVLKNFGTLRNGENGTVCFVYEPQSEGEVLDADVIQPQQKTPQQVAEEPVAVVAEKDAEEVLVADDEPTADVVRGDVYDEYDDEEEYIEPEPKELGKSRYDDRQEVLKSTSIRRDSSIKGLKYKGSGNISQRGSSYKGGSSAGISGWLLVVVVAAALLAIGMLLWGEVFSSVNDMDDEVVVMSKPEPTVPNPDAEYTTPFEGNK
jgi:nucleoid DNA-binding protein